MKPLPRMDAVWRRAPAPFWHHKTDVHGPLRDLHVMLKEDENFLFCTPPKCSFYLRLLLFLPHQVSGNQWLPDFWTRDMGIWKATQDKIQLPSSNHLHFIKEHLTPPSNKNIHISHFPTDHRKFSHQLTENCSETTEQPSQVAHVY